MKALIGAVVAAVLVMAVWFNIDVVKNMADTATAPYKAWKSGDRSIVDKLIAPVPERARDKDGNLVDGGKATHRGSSSGDHESGKDRTPWFTGMGEFEHGHGRGTGGKAEDRHAAGRTGHRGQQGKGYGARAVGVQRARGL